MDPKLPPIPLESGLDLRQIVTTGSMLQINEDYDETNLDTETNDTNEYVPRHVRLQNAIGEPVKSLEALVKELKDVDENGFVKKKIIEEGGGEPLHDGCTVSVAYSGYWEGENEPFDIRKLMKPLVVDLQENGLLPGLQIAIKSMLVGETSVFLLSYKVMYGEIGIPPRIKPKADCVFYIKLLKGTFTEEDDGDLDIAEPNTFRRVHKNVKMLYCSGVALFKVNNYGGAIHLFNKGVYVLHKCRLADEKEQNQQERLLMKFYLNLAICYNKIKKPLKACTACNELNRLENLWNNAKALFQNAKALRMIGDFKSAEKKLKRAMNLSSDDSEMKNEYKLLMSTKKYYDQKRIISGGSLDLISDSFKQEVDNLVRDFKENDNLCKLTLPCKLNATEMEYIKKVCIRENLFFDQVHENYLLDKDEEDKENNYLDLDGTNIDDLTC